MKDSLVSLLCFFIISVSLSSQEKLYLNDSVLHKIETFILKDQLDSVSLLIAKQKQTPYIEVLKRIYRKENPSYSDYYKFVSNVANSPDVSYGDVSNYINKTINTPQNYNEINLDYVTLKWSQVSKLRDEATIEEANTEQDKLEAYIKRFNPNDVNTIKANLLASTHQLVLLQIQNDVKRGKALCLENLKKADELGDTRLKIIFLYHLCDYYIVEGKLTEYIQASEQSLELENTLPTKTSYYIGTIIHLLDAYIYKGSNKKRVEELLSLLYSKQDTRQLSYSLYAKYISTLGADSSKLQSVFKQFEVSSVLEFCKKIESLGENTLNPNDFFHVLNESSRALAAHGFLNEAIRYKDKCIVLTRKIYSEDLSQSLSSFKTKQAVKAKEVEIERVTERSNLYIVIATLVASLLLITFVFLIRKRKQSRLLEIKNGQINQALKEKELLVKEVHHRVKNNFQIIASLLELQAKSITDEKALAFANESKNRLKSMALVHQKLYQDKEGLINFDQYVRQLINEVSALHNSKDKVDIHIFTNNLFFDIDTALPLGLIVNELVTNAYKYAFSTTINGILHITINKINNGKYKLTVLDNGPGIPNEYSAKSSEGFGLNLVNRLVKQLSGTLSIYNNNGTCIEIVFQDKNARKTID
ncbi:two-component sensor histidine kinase [Jejuia pallidilutea]|uniref:Two-component sensor histidine kinase n=1 Tax=Jejuia pallidilutea TaxID=504487 RepID=A0A362XBL6_9FLAO|nr:sensor histidine kinase [Jejuia pallidilutea]PQV48162.1 two-component sensor histidine kinase [Jejuia pallidilutea]